MEDSPRTVPLRAIELTAAKYVGHRQAATDERFLGGAAVLGKSWLKQSRRKRLG